MTAALLESVRAHREAMVEFTRELVAIPTENPPGNAYRDAVQLIARRLSELGLSDTRLEGDCVLSFVGDGERVLYFSGHYDVVPAQSQDQFEPKVKARICLDADRRT